MSQGTIVDRPGPSYQLRYQVAGKTATESFPKSLGKKAAQARLRELLSRVDHGATIAPSKESFAAWNAEWQRAIRNEISPVTLKLYAAQSRLHLVPRFGHYKLREIDMTAIRGAWADLGNVLQPASIHVLHRIMSACMSYAVEAKRIDHNPCANWRKGRGLPKLNDDAERPILTVFEAHTLIAVARSGATTGPFAGRGWMLPPIVIALGCGARRSEIAALTWDRVNLDTGELKISEAIRELSAADIRRGGTKTGKARRPVLPAWAIEELRQWKRTQAEQLLRAGHRSTAVCTKPDGSPVNPNAMTGGFAYLAARIGRPDMSFHCLRHTSASWALAASASVKDVQLMLGHAKPSITLNTYSHAMPDSAAGIAQKLNDKMGS